MQRAFLAIFLSGFISYKKVKLFQVNENVLPNYFYWYEYCNVFVWWFPGSEDLDANLGFVLRHDFLQKHFHEVSFEIAMNANILVIDDEESIRFTFYKFLAEKGNHVCTSKNLLESLSKMKEKVYDLIIVDIILSDGCGLDVLKKINRNEVETQVIIMTAYPTMETIDMSFKMHAADYIVKPIRQSELISSVSKIIQKKISLRKNYMKNDEICA